LLTRAGRLLIKEMNNKIARLLSMIDQNPVSPTYGCFDRDWWHYRIARDFPSAVFQQGVLTLSTIYAFQFKGNDYYQDEGIKELAIVGMEYWSRIQHRDGSFSEWFPGERSLVATAFTAYAVSESLKILSDKIDKARKDNIINALKQAGCWLISQKESFVANHTAGQIAALYNIYQLSGEDKFKCAAEQLLSELSSGQDSEGWFSEYGGADIGYLSLSINYLAGYYSASGDEKALLICGKALEFMKYFIHPDGSAGGEYSSRNTSYLMRWGLISLRGKIKNAGEILSHLKIDKVSLVDSADDRYLNFFLLPDYVRSLAAGAGDMLPGKNQDEFSKYFPNAGLLSIKNKNYQLVINLKKGGVIKLYRVGVEPRLVFSDTGYFINLGNEGCSTFWNNSQAASGKFISLTSFSPIKSILASPIKFILLRAYAFLFGWSGFMMKILDCLMKEILIARYKPGKIFLQREIIPGEDGIEVIDLITGSNISEINKLVNGHLITEGSSPSSRYSLPGGHSSKSTDLTSKLSELINDGKITIKRKISLNH